MAGFNQATFETLGADPVPFYEMTFEGAHRWRRMAETLSDDIELPEWAMVAAGAAFCAMAGLLAGAWLHI